MNCGLGSNAAFVYACSSVFSVYSQCVFKVTKKEVSPIHKSINTMNVSTTSENSPSFFQSSCTGTTEALRDEMKDEVTVGQEGMGLPQSDVCNNGVAEHMMPDTFIKIPKEEWSKSLDKLPLFTEGMIDYHLIYKSSTMPDKKGTQAYRHKQKGYRLFKEGYVQNVVVKADVKSQDNVKLLVKAKVAASMKQKLYNVHVHLIQQNGEVAFANCSCKSGKGGCCKHVAAVLYTLWDYSTLGLKIVPDNLTCTQVSQKWNVPSKGAMQATNAVYFEELTFEKADFKRDQSNCRKRSLVNGVREHYCVSPQFVKQVKVDEIHALSTALQKAGKCQLLCAALSGNNYLPCTTFTTSANRSLRIAESNREPEKKIAVLDLQDTGFFDRFSTYHPQLTNNIKLSPECEKYFMENIVLNVKNSKLIEYETRLQSESKSWFIHRALRLTSSIFGRVMTRKGTTNPENLVKEVCKERICTKDDKLPPSLRWGKENEPVAIKRYSQTQEGANRNIYSTGLIVNPNYPWLGCSPDGILVSKEGFVEGCIEVKCPYTHRDKTIKEAINDKKFFLAETESGVKLKPRHHYYYQCQGVMALTELPWIHFITFTSDDIHIERILHNEKVWKDEMLPKLTAFYFENILPYLEQKSSHNN